jgi:hypothetical protein
MTKRLEYVANPRASIVGPRRFSLEVAGVERAVHRSHELIGRLAAFEIDVFALLGMRNLSAFIGEVFAAAMILEYPELFRKNPHQDGYPDLLLLDGFGTAEWARLADRLRDKAPFSPFATGGFEVKATCGEVPTPAKCQQRGFEKPDIGDQRIGCLTGYNWKAHHRETNHLFGLFWDFMDGAPAVVAVFYSAALVETDWGKVVKPRDGGGRTTSVSTMKRDGVRKMYNGWITVINSSPYAQFFDSRNRSAEMAAAMARAT